MSANGWLFLSTDERRALRLALDRLASDELGFPERRILLLKLEHTQLAPLLEDLRALKPRAHQRELAELAGCARETVTRLVGGKRG